MIEVRLQIDPTDKTQRDLLNKLMDAIAPKKVEKAPKKVEEAPKPGITLNDVRTAISEKAPLFRDEVVAKLNEFGAKNATELAEEHYEEYVKYLATL